MVWDERTVAFLIAQATLLYAYLSYYGSLRPRTVLLQGVLSGVLGGVLLLLFAPVLQGILPEPGSALGIFVNAAVVEKAMSLAVLLALARAPTSGGRRFVAMGVHFGAGFAFLENAVYAMNYQVEAVYIRFISSVPMHLATCGIQAYFIAMGRLYEHPVLRRRSYFFALTVPVLLHGIYDVSCFPGLGLELISGPMIVMSVLVFEMIHSRMQTFPNDEDLARRRLRIEDWFTLEKQLAYGKWILYSAGTRNLPHIGFFRMQRSFFRMGLAILLLALALLYWLHPGWYRGLLRVDLNDTYGMALFGMMPLSFAVIFAVIGSVNPEYFRNKRLRIPVVVDAGVRQGAEFVTGFSYEVTPVSMFVHSEDFLQEGEPMQLNLEYLGRPSGSLDGTVRRVVQAGDELYPSGMIVDVEPHGPAFQSFFRSYTLFRLRKGLSLLLSIPGSHAVRTLFVRPLTVMQQERGYRAGDTIFRQGDAGRRFYLIKKGRVAIYKELENGERMLLSELGVGAIFGEMALVSTSVRSATAVCTADCVLAIAHRDHLDALMQANPEFVTGIIRNLIQIIDKNEQEISRLKSKE